MKAHFHSSIVLSGLATICLSNLAFIPEAQAQQQPMYKIDSGAGKKIESQQKIDTQNINDKWDLKNKLDKNIQDTRLSNQEWSDAKGNLFGLLVMGSIFSFTSPSVISADGGVGYGTQIMYPIHKQILFRGGFHFQPSSTTFNAGATYSLFNGSPITPFFGGGWRTKSFGSNYVGVRNDGFYGTAGADIFLDPLIVTVQANQAVNGGSTEFQGTVNFIRLLFGS